MFGLFKKKLPHCDALFEKYFSPWYEEGDRSKITRPDMFQIAAYAGQPVKLDEIQYLGDEYLSAITKHINVTMQEATLSDFQHISNCNKFDLDVLDAVDKYYDRAKIAKLIKDSNPADFSNDYLVTVCEFGIMLGHLFNQIDGFGWLYSHPYFHSIIVHKNTGFGIPVFDWAIKKFSEYGVDDGFVAKINMALETVKKSK